MSSSSRSSYSHQAVVRRTEVVDNFFYDIDRALAQFLDHWQNYRDNELEDIEVEVEDNYRGFDVEEENLYFEITAESDSRAVIKLEYRDQKQDGLEYVQGKLDKVWDRRIKTVLERGKK